MTPIFRPGDPWWHIGPCSSNRSPAKSPGRIRNFPVDDYHPHYPDAEADHMVLLMALAARLVLDADEADEPVLVRAVDC